MSRILLISTLFFVFSSFRGDVGLGQKHLASDIIGTYMNQEKDAKVRIFLAMNDKYSGKVEWMIQPNYPNGTRKLDTENPDPSKRNRERLGLVVLKDYSYDPVEDRWTGGTVYDPKVGKTYDGYIQFADSDNKILNLRGYVLGMPLLGRTATWTRVD
jgi:uncharacterized protein (DUF2147 family)